MFCLRGLLLGVAGCDPSDKWLRCGLCNNLEINVEPQYAEVLQVVNLSEG